VGKLSSGLRALGSTAQLVFLESRVVDLVAAASEDDMLGAFRDAEGDLDRRGWPDAGLFSGFPRWDCDWSWVQLSDNDLETRVRQLRNEPTWWLLTRGSYRPIDVAGFVRGFELRDDVDELVRATVRRICDSRDRLVAERSPPPPIILADAGSGSDPVVLKGNKRVAAAVLANVPPSRFRFLLARSAAMPLWTFYCDRPPLTQELRMHGYETHL
jgi:hypothetical protein